MKKLFMIGIIVIVLVLTGCSRDSHKEFETVAINCGRDRIYVAQEEEFTLTQKYIDIINSYSCVAEGGSIIISQFPKENRFYEPITFKEGEKIIIPEGCKQFIIFRKE